MRVSNRASTAAATAEAAALELVEALAMGDNWEVWEVAQVVDVVVALVHTADAKGGGLAPVVEEPMAQVEGVETAVRGVVVMAVARMVAPALTGMVAVGGAMAKAVARKEMGGAEDATVMVE